MTQKVAAEHGADPARIYVAGLSAGGAMAAILGETYPDLFAAVGVHSGLAAGSARDLQSALAAMKKGAPAAAKSAAMPPTIVFHGDADNTVHPANGTHVTAAATTAGTAPDVKREQVSAGRDFTRSVHRSADGRVVAEHWVVHGSAHAWSGGSSAGSYTDPRGPDASAEMLRFFLEHPRTA
jgi:poly(3-hydroxybutyrate) depolymerase